MAGEDDVDTKLRGTLILDGGLSTQLERHHGVDLSAHPTLWTAGLLLTSEGRAALHAAHVAFAVAGADIVLSGTYQASGKPALSDDAIQAGVDVAVRAAREATDALGRRVRAWLSVGPFGATLANGSEYTGEYPEQQATYEALLAFHSHRLSVLLGAAEAGSLGGVAFETIPSGTEARALAQLAAHSPALSSRPCWISLQCRADGRFLADGTPLAPLAEELCGLLAGRAPLTGLGANCMPASAADLIVETLIAAAEAQRPRVALPSAAATAPAAAHAAHGRLAGGLARWRGVDTICVYPNEGGCWDAEHRCWKAEAGAPDEGGAAPRSFACTGARRWRDRIVRAGMLAVVGGCCNSDQALVAELRAELCTTENSEEAGASTGGRHVT